VKDSVPPCETASIFAADLSPDHLSGPQRLRQMYSAIVARGKSSPGGEWQEIWEEESKPRGNVPEERGVWGERLQPFSFYASRSPSTLRDSCKSKVLE